MHFEEYKQIKAMNGSTLVHGRTSMLHLKAAMDSIKEETKEMRFGSGFHSLLLTPDEFESNYCVVPDFHMDEGNKTQQGKQSTSKGTTYYEQKVKEFAELNKGKTFLLRSEYDEALCMIEALRNKPEVQEIFEAAGDRRELTLMGEIEGVPFKGRLDLLTDFEVPDVKTARSLDYERFGYAARDLGYAMKMACYMELARQNFPGDRGACLILVEKTEPFDVVVDNIPKFYLDKKLEEAKEILRQYKKCLASGVWPGIDGGHGRREMFIPNSEIPDDLDWSVSESPAEAEDYEEAF